jgi:hypothetical protein
MLIIAVLWPAICLAIPTIHAGGEGYEVSAVTDASGGVTRESKGAIGLRDPRTIR